MGSKARRAWTVVWDDVDPFRACLLMMSCVAGIMAVTDSMHGEPPEAATFGLIAVFGALPFSLVARDRLKTDHAFGVHFQRFVGPTFLVFLCLSSCLVFRRGRAGMFLGSLHTILIALLLHGTVVFIWLIVTGFFHASTSGRGRRLASSHDLIVDDDPTP